MCVPTAEMVAYDDLGKLVQHYLNLVLQRNREINNLRNDYAELLGENERLRCKLIDLEALENTDE